MEQSAVIDIVEELRAKLAEKKFDGETLDWLKARLDEQQPDVESLKALRALIQAQELDDETALALTDLEQEQMQRLSGALSDDELDNVSGGGCKAWNNYEHLYPGKPPTYYVNSKNFIPKWRNGYWMCPHHKNQASPLRVYCTGDQYTFVCDFCCCRFIMEPPWEHKDKGKGSKFNMLNPFM